MYHLPNPVVAEIKQENPHTVDRCCGLSVALPVLPIPTQFHSPPLPCAPLHARGQTRQTLFVKLQLARGRPCRETEDRRQEEMRHLPLSCSALGNVAGRARIAPEVPVPPGQPTASSAPHFLAEVHLLNSLCALCFLSGLRHSSDLRSTCGFE